MKKIFLTSLLVFLAYILSAYDYKIIEGAWVLPINYKTTFIPPFPELDGIDRRYEEKVGDSYYDVPWVFLTIDLSSNEKSMQHWGFHCIIDEIIKETDDLFYFDVTFYDTAIDTLRPEEKARYLIQIIDEDKIMINVITMTDLMAFRAMNSSFSPFKIDGEFEKDFIYVRATRIEPNSGLRKRN